MPQIEHHTGSAHHLVACDECGGWGGREVAHPSWDDPYYSCWETCRECNGSGLVEEK